MWVRIRQRNEVEKMYERKISEDGIKNDGFPRLTAFQL